MNNILQLFQNERKMEDRFFQENPQIKKYICKYDYSLEAYKVELGLLMDYEEAKMLCFCLGDGWRLPSMSELMFISNEANRYLREESKSYWTSSLIIDNPEIKSYNYKTGIYDDISECGIMDYHYKECSVSDFDSINSHILYNIDQHRLEKFINDKEYGRVIPVRDL